MFYLNKKVDNSKYIIHLFNYYFSNTYILNNNVYPISKFNLNEVDVFNELWNISLNSNGPRRNFSNILKICAFILTPVITALFNRSLDSSIFPDKWKS